MLAFLDEELARGRGRVCEREMKRFRACVREAAALPPTKTGEARGGDWVDRCLVALGPVLACTTMTGTNNRAQYVKFHNEFPKFFERADKHGDTRGRGVGRGRGGGLRGQGG